MPAETLFCKNYSGALLSHDIFYDMGMFSTYPSLQSSAYLHVLCSQIMVMPLRNWIYLIFTFFFFFGHSMQLAGILAQSANQCTSGEVPVSTILNLNRFTGPRANFLNSAFSGSVHARRIVMGYQMEKRAIQVSTCLIDSLCCTEETNNSVSQLQ